MASLLKSRRLWVATALVVVSMALLWVATPYLRGILVARDADRPYLVEFGRGSGMDGLYTIKVMADGTVILHGGDGHRDWKTARLTLPEEAIARIRGVMAASRLGELERAYHGGVEDGTQWVLRFEHDGREKAVYFDNCFPEPVERFAATLDEILAENGLGQTSWRRVEYFGNQTPDRALWDSIRR